MTITAQVIADSINKEGVRLTTFQLRYPRFIHAEVMTHRVFSRNASSSRAIPVERMIKDIVADTAMPIHWGRNQPGMQAFEEQDAKVVGSCGELDMLDARVYGVTRETAWTIARDRAIEVARDFHNAGYHKQIVNRILEPFMHINVIVTATNFDNFYWLRRHPDAQPEIKALADAMYKAQAESSPVLLQPGQWHLPYVTVQDHQDGAGKQRLYEDLIKISVARCARVSYKTHDGRTPRVEEDIALYDRLIGSTPLHASPAEHQAYADYYGPSDDEGWAYDNPHLSGNFDPGFVQYRKTLTGEFCEAYDG